LSIYFIINLIIGLIIRPPRRVTGGEDLEGRTGEDGLEEFDDIAAEPPEEEEEARGEEGDGKSKFGD